MLGIEDAEELLSRIILFDQFPRNMFRGDKRAYETDKFAIILNSIGMSREYDKELEPIKRKFVYMPLLHMETIFAHELAIALFEDMKDEETLKWALHHYNIIKRFGRFPHRNAILGRESTEAEKKFLQENSFGI